MDTVRWGIIGCGDVCEVKSGPGFQLAQGSELVAVMRRDGKLAGDFARRHGVPKWTDNAQTLIDDPDVNAVYVATPVSSHRDYAMAAAAAGKPCYVEKPMARNHAECLEMVRAFDEAGLKLFVAYYRRALPRFLKARELLQARAIGRVTSVNYRYSAGRHRNLDPADLQWRLQAEHSGGGLAMDLASHTLDILDFLLGPLGDPHGRASNVGTPEIRVEDNVALTFTTPSGAIGSACWNFAARHREDRIEILGTEGRLALSTFGTEPVQLRTADGEQSFDLPNPKHVQAPLIQTIVDDLLGRGTCESTGTSAARTNAVLDAALSGYYGGRHDAFWTRPDTWPGQAR